MKKIWCVLVAQSGIVMQIVIALSSVELSVESVENERVVSRRGWGRCGEVELPSVCPLERRFASGIEG